MGSSFRVNPAGDGHKVRDKALDVAAEDDVVAQDHRLKVHVHPVILMRHWKQKRDPDENLTKVTKKSARRMQQRGADENLYSTPIWRNGTKGGQVQMVVVACDLPRQPSR